MDQLPLICVRCKKRYVKDGRSSCAICLEKQSVYAAERRQDRKEKNLCRYCGKNQVKLGDYFCSICLKNNKNKRDLDKATGQCIYCSNIAVKDKVTCEKCTKRTRKNEARIRKERKRDEVCIKCGQNKVTKPHVKCDDCLSKQCKSWHDKVENFENLGVCVGCGGQRLQGNRFCEVCYLKKVATKRLGTSSKWPLLKLLFEKQTGYCPYSGEKLILGSNASLDHIIPVCDGGDNTEPNIQWVLDMANEMKWYYSEKEFLRLVKQIYEYRNLQNYE